MTLDNISVSDDLQDITLTTTKTLDTGPSFVSSNQGSSFGTLKPNEIATFLGTYVIRQVDVDAGGLSNQASVTAQTPANVTINDASDDGNDFDQNTVDDRTETVIPRTPGIEVTKTSTITDNNGDNTYGVGDTVVYTITVQNTGNLDFTSVVLEDVLSKKNGGTLALTVTPTFLSSTLGSNAGSLKVSETATYVASYTIAQDAIDGGGLSNQASVTADSLTTSVTDLSDDGDDTDGNNLDDPTENTLFGTLILEATKTATITDVDGNVLVKQGTLVNGTVTKSEKRKAAGTKGKLAFSVDFIKAVDGQSIPVNLKFDFEGKSKTGVAVAAGALVAAPLLLIKGKPAVIEQGTVFQALVVGDKKIKTKK